MAWNGTTQKTIYTYDAKIFHSAQRSVMQMRGSQENDRKKSEKTDKLWVFAVILHYMQSERIQFWRNTNLKRKDTHMVLRQNMTKRIKLQRKCNCKRIKMYAPTKVFALAYGGKSIRTNSAVAKPCQNSFSPQVTQASELQTINCLPLDPYRLSPCSR